MNVQKDTRSLDENRAHFYFSFVQALVNVHVNMNCHCNHLDTSAVPVPIYPWEYTKRALPNAFTGDVIQDGPRPALPLS